MIRVINRNGHILDYNASFMFMDRNILKNLQENLKPQSEQEFFSAYENEHLKVFGEEWVLSKKDPIW
jgi:hypothetical protein